MLYSRSHRTFSPIVSSRSLKSFMFYCLVLDSFSVNFVHDASHRSKFIFFTYWYLIVPISFVEQTILFPLTQLCTFEKDQLSIYMWIYFWILNSALLINLSAFMPIPHCLEYCSFRVSPESRQCWSSNCVLSLSCFGYFRFFAF